MPDYQNGLIYKIYCKDSEVKDVYVGSTCDFASRKYAHRMFCRNPNTEKYNYKLYRCIRANGGMENWIIKPIKFYPCDSKRELHKEERRYIEELNATLNTHIPTRTKREYIADNQDKIKQFYLNNKDRYKLYAKRYYSTHKAQRKEYNLRNKSHKSAYDKARYLRLKQQRQLNN